MLDINRGPAAPKVLYQTQNSLVNDKLSAPIVGEYESKARPSVSPNLSASAQPTKTMPALAQRPPTPLVLEPVVVAVQHPQPRKLVGVTLHKDTDGGANATGRPSMAVPEAEGKTDIPKHVQQSNQIPPTKSGHSAADLLEVVKSRKRAMYQILSMLNKTNKPGIRKTLCTRLHGFADLGYELVVRNNRYCMSAANAVAATDRRIWRPESPRSSLAAPKSSLECHHFAPPTREDQINFMAQLEPQAVKTVLVASPSQQSSRPLTPPHNLAIDGELKVGSAKPIPSAPPQLVRSLTPPHSSAGGDELKTDGAKSVPATLSDSPHVLPLVDLEPTAPPAPLEAALAAQPVPPAPQLVDLPAAAVDVVETTVELVDPVGGGYIETLWRNGKKESIKWKNLDKTPVKLPNTTSAPKPRPVAVLVDDDDEEGKERPESTFSEFYVSSAGGNMIRYHKKTVEALAARLSASLVRHMSIKERDADLAHVSQCSAQSVFRMAAKPVKEGGYDYDPTADPTFFDERGFSHATQLYAAEAISQALRTSSELRRAVRVDRNFNVPDHFGVHRLDAAVDLKAISDAYGQKLTGWRLFKRKCQKAWQVVKHPVAPEKRKLVLTVDLPVAIRRTVDNLSLQTRPNKSITIPVLRDAMKHLAFSIHSGGPAIITLQNFH